MTLRNLVVALFILIPATSFGAPSVLIDFTNGNQIFGSHLTIFSDGSIAHLERTCCPPQTKTIPEPHLTATQLNHLKASIAAAAIGEVLIENGSKTSEGSQSGELIEYVAGQPVIIFKVERNPVSGNSNKVYRNTSWDAVIIKSMVEGYVKNHLVP